MYITWRKAGETEIGLLVMCCNKVVCSCGSTDRVYYSLVALAKGSSKESSIFSDRRQLTLIF